MSSQVTIPLGQPGPNPAPGDSTSQGQQQLVPGTPEYIAEMVRRAENPGTVLNPQKYGQQPSASQVPAMPEGGYEKFYNKETGAYNWEAHARELEFKLQQKGKQPQQQPKAQQPKIENDNDEADDAAQNAVNEAGLDMNALGQQIMDSGDIDEAAYQKLEKIGIDRETVKGYIDYLKTRAEQTRKECIEYFGGEQQMNAALQWARTNLSREEIDSINELLASPKWKTGVDALMGRYTTGRNTAGEPRLVAGDNVPSSQTGFASQFEMIQAISKKLPDGRRQYDVDPEYRKMVRQKIALMR